jgi:hypothetical protein
LKRLPHRGNVPNSNVWGLLMCKGLSKQQKRILEELESGYDGKEYVKGHIIKLVKYDFSTMDIIYRIKPDISWREYNKYHVSFYRALMNLKKRNEVITWLYGNKRFWARSMAHLTEKQLDNYLNVTPS